MNSVRSCCSAALMALAATGLFAQGEGLGSWNILNLKYQGGERWNAFMEAQVRSLRFYDDFHYHEVKGGLEWRMRQGPRLALGLGKYDTYREGGDFVRPKNADEVRLWPQVILVQNAGRMRIEQRYRAEMRFLQSGYRNRFRYRLGLSYPFGPLHEGERAWTIGVSNELFFTDREPYFERNRLLAHMNRRIARSAALQLGYLHQFDYRINDETGRDFLVVGLYIELRPGQGGSVGDANGDRQKP